MSVETDQGWRSNPEEGQTDFYTVAHALDLAGTTYWYDTMTPYIPAGRRARPTLTNVFYLNNHDGSKRHFGWYAYVLKTYEVPGKR